MLWMIPLAAFSIGLLMGYAPLRACRSDVTWGFVGLLLALGGWAVFKELTVSGVDGLVFTLLGLFVVTPSLIATAIGAALASLRPRTLC